MRELRIGLFLGLRQIQRASIWSTALIVAIVLFTFLNLVLLSGILIGIIDGAMYEARTRALGDVSISPKDGETKIQETEKFTQILNNYHEVAAFSPRYMGMATIEANYTERRRLSDEPDVIAVSISGVDPIAEENTTSLGQLVVEGEYLDPNETGYLLLGKYNVDRYAAEFGDVFDSLKNIYPGSKVLVTANGQTREFTVKGIVASKSDFVSLAVYMPERELRRMFGRADYNADSIIVRLHPEYDRSLVSERLRSGELGNMAKIRSFEEDIPKFIVDVRDTFKLLSAIVGIFGILIASITIFIVIFINVLSRRRQIGILKAIGVTSRTIEYAYMTQAVFYVVIGALTGILVTYFWLIPYFIANPIDFPYAHASLSITTEGLFLRALALLGVAVVAGFIPAKMITRQNTLNTILGRK